MQKTDKKILSSSRLLSFQGVGNLRRKPNLDAMVFSSAVVIPLKGLLPDAPWRKLIPYPEITISRKEWCDWLGVSYGKYSGPYYDQTIDETGQGMVHPLSAPMIATAYTRRILKFVTLERADLVNIDSLFRLHTILLDNEQMLTCAIELWRDGRFEPMDVKRIMRALARVAMMKEYYNYAGCERALQKVIGERYVPIRYPLIVDGMVRYSLDENIGLFKLFMAQGDPLGLNRLDVGLQVGSIINGVTH